MRGILAAGLACCAALGVGCSFTSVETTFNDTLIRDVGAGSVAIKTIETTITDAAKANVTFTAPNTEKAMERLVSGQLNLLSPEDMRLIARTNRVGRQRFERILRRLDAVKAEIDSAGVDVARHDDLSDGARDFLRAWNDYLAASGQRVARMRTGLAELRPLFRRFDILLAAAIGAARLGHTREFERVRARELATLQNDFAKFERTTEAVTKPGNADKRLLDLINDDQEARAIIREVNERYPEGYLTELKEAE